MDRKNEKTLVALGEEELSSVAGGNALAAALGPLSTALAVDAKQMSNLASVFQGQQVTTVGIGGPAFTGLTSQDASVVQGNVG
jgi:hypothetical protein